MKSEIVELFNNLSPAMKRDIVAQVAGLDASILLTFKRQVEMVDSILSKMISNQNTLTGYGEEDTGISLKDALGMSIKLTQMMIKDLPKVYNLERIQRQERALLSVMERCLTREQQEEVLLELEKIKKSNAI